MESDAVPEELAGEGRMDVHFEPVDSRAELLERLRREPRSVLVGQDEENPREFSLIALPNCLIGLCSNSHGIKPRALVDPVKRAIWLGFGCSVARVDIHACQQFTVTLSAPFYELLTQMPDGSLIVIHEVGACRIDRIGTLVWSFSANDIVTDFADEGDRVRVRTWDGGEVHIEKSSGSIG